MPRESTWQTVSQLSVTSMALPSLPSDVQKWFLSVLEFLDQEDFEIDSVAEQDPDQVLHEMIRYRNGVVADHRKGRSQDSAWVTESENSLPRLGMDGFKTPKVSIPILQLGTIKQRWRNAAVFPPAIAAGASPFVSSTGGSDTSRSFPSSSSVRNQQPSTNTLVSGTSGGFQVEPQALRRRREPPHHDSPTLKVLEGRGPYVLDARDISSSQFRTGRSFSQDTLLVRRHPLLQSMLADHQTVSSTRTERTEQWTSGILDQMQDEILSTLNHMESDIVIGQTSKKAMKPVVQPGGDQTGERTVGIKMVHSFEEVEGRALEEDICSSESVLPAPTPPAIAPARVGARKERFGRLGRWFKRKVLRKDSTTPDAQ